MPSFQKMSNQLSKIICLNDRLVAQVACIMKRRMIGTVMRENATKKKNCNYKLTCINNKATKN